MLPELALCNALKQTVDDPEIPPVSMIDNDGCQAARPPDAVHLAEHALRICGGVVDAPAPDEVEASVGKALLLGIHLDNRAENAIAAKPFLVIVEAASVKSMPMDDLAYGAMKEPCMP